MNTQPITRAFTPSQIYDGYNKRLCGQLNGRLYYTDACVLEFDKPNNKEEFKILNDEQLRKFNIFLDFLSQYNWNGRTNDYLIAEAVKSDRVINTQFDSVDDIGTVLLTPKHPREGRQVFEFVNARYFNYLVKKYKKALIYIRDYEKECPVVFVVNGEVKALLMPIKRKE